MRKCDEAIFRNIFSHMLIWSGQTATAGIAGSAVQLRTQWSEANLYVCGSSLSP